MSNEKKIIEVTKEYLDSINYFKLKGTLEELGIGEAFKGGTKKSAIIREAMKMYSQLEAAKAGNLDHDAEVKLQNEIEEELAIIETSVLTVSASDSITTTTDGDVTIKGTIEKPKGRSIEVIEAHLVQVTRLVGNCIPQHKIHWGERLNKIEAELAEAKK